MNIGGLDLNLLRVFDAVYRERNATRAARRVGLSQPAVSNALSRLRAQISDPLFLRAPEGLRPTPRADALAEPVRRALSLLEDALDGPEFDPADTRRSFRIAAVDYALITLIPRVAARLEREAPRAGLAARPSLGTTYELLDEGEIDVGLLIRDAPPERFEREPLLRDDYVVLMRRDHPLAEGPFDLDRYVAARHLLVSPTLDSRAGVVDQALADYDRERRVVMTVAEFATTPPILAATDLILTCPRRVGALYGRPMGLTARETPIPIKHSHNGVAMIWRRRFGETEPQRWFRALIREEAAALMAIDDPVAP